jgi:hypothetical protein
MREKKTLERAKKNKTNNAGGRTEPEKPNKSRSQAALKALEHEGRHGALASDRTRQAHERASQSEPTSPSRAAEKALQTKGKRKTGLRRAA